MSTLLLCFLTLLAPATSPTNSAEADLRRIVAGLQQQIAVLKAQLSDSQKLNESLQKQNFDLRLANADAAAAPVGGAKLPPGTDDVAIMDQIKQGMTRNQVVKIIGSQPTSEVNANPGGSTLTWKFTGMTGPSGDPRENVGHREVVAAGRVDLDDDGKVVRVAKIKY